MPRIPGPRSPLALLKWARAATADPYRALVDAQDQFGPISAIDVGPVGRLVLLLGPEANEFVLSTHARAFRWHEAMRTLIPVEGETSLIVSDGDDHARRRKVVQPAFHKRAIDQHLRLLTDEADRVIDSWSVGAELDGYRATASAIERMAIAVLGGPHLRHRSHELAARLSPAIEFVNQPLYRQLPLPWPGTRYHRARAGRRAVEGIIDEEIERRSSSRLGPDHEMATDVLAMLIESESDDTMSRQEVRDQIISLIGNYDTTSAAVGWAVHRLVSEPFVWARVAEELDDVVGSRELAVTDLARLPYLDGVVKETLRLHPPSVYSPREVGEPFDFGGYHVRKGTIVLFSPFVTGRDPSQFPDPEAFRPERWDASRPDHVEPHPYAFVPFGGRARRCIGFALADLQIKVMIVQLVRRTELAPATTRPPQPQGTVAVRPGGGVPIRVLAVRRRAGDVDLRTPDERFTPRCSDHLQETRA
jgi:cytochrome P450